MASHPNVRTRGGEASRAIVFATDPAVIDWIDTELAGQAIAVQTARSVKQLVISLVDDPPPRAQILIADFDAMTPSDVLHLHVIRERGWFGSVIGLGKVADALRTSLTIDQVLIPPHPAGALRKAVSAVGLARPTTKIPKLR